MLDKIEALAEELGKPECLLADTGYPHQGDHRDVVAEAMAQPANPQAVLHAIRSAHGAAATSATKTGGDEGA